MHTFVEIALLAFLMVGLSLSIFMIGKPSQPYTPGAVMIGMFLTFAQAAGIIYLAHT
jgi:hypothetical protein